VKISKISDIFKVENIGYISDIYRGYISSIYIMPTLVVTHLKLSDGHAIVIISEKVKHCQGWTPVKSGRAGVSLRVSISNRVRWMV